MLKPSNDETDRFRVCDATWVFERAGQRITLDFTMGAESHKPWIVKADAGATAEQVALREAWLAGGEGAGSEK